MPELKIAVVCFNNLNRSMEAHDYLGKKGFQVSSFGCGSHVRLPAKEGKPHVYEFSVSYEQMYEDLVKLDESYYTENGILQMLQRNKVIKSHPQRFQDCNDQFDVIFTVEAVVFEIVIDNLETRYKHYAAHIVNLEVQDSHKDAPHGAFLLGELATKMSASEDLYHEVYDIIESVEGKQKKPILHAFLGEQQY